ncbi:MAG: hypothetical protein M3P06_00680 [Acidobacteriota bacterium]|nr:hypothetical protein [Acidobacteriota bacterium]
MTSKSDWQNANRELIADQRRQLGDPPAAEELLAYSRGELSESEEEEVRDRLVAYPELARMYAAPFPEEGDAVSDDHQRDDWRALQRRLGHSDEEPQRGRVLFFRYAPVSVAAALALLFFGLFVQSERSSRYHAAQSTVPRILAAPQELDPDGDRSADAPTMLRKDGEAYLLKPRLINQVRYPHYGIELRDANDARLWQNNSAQPDEYDSFQIAIPHAFLRTGERYKLKVFGMDGNVKKEVGSYDVAVPAE